jgi:hypothetical protein
MTRGIDASWAAANERPGERVGPDDLGQRNDFALTEQTSRASGEVLSWVNFAPIDTGLTRQEGSSGHYEEGDARLSRFRAVVS